MEKLFTIGSARKFKGLSQKEIALALGVSLNTVRNYEKGETQMPAVVFLEYCDLLSIQPNHFKKELV